MKQGRISQTALKVGLSLITLEQKDDWAARLPPGLVEMTERLILATGTRGYGPATMRASKRPWMLQVYRFQDRAILPGQFEGFGHRTIFMDRQVTWSCWEPEQKSWNPFFQRLLKKAGILVDQVLT